MMKILRTSVAVAALIAGTALVNAQSDYTRSESGAEQKNEAPAQASPEESERRQPGAEGRSVSPEQPAAEESRSQKMRPGGESKSQPSGDSKSMRGTEGRSVSPEPGQTERKAAPSHESRGARGKQEQTPATGRSVSPGADQTEPNAAPAQKRHGARDMQPQTPATGRSVSPGADQTEPNAAPAQKRRGGAMQGGAMQGKGAQTGAEGRSSFGLSSDQQTQVREGLIKQRSARIGHVDFDVAIGTVVPRTVHFGTLPPRIVRIVPRYRGFKFFIVNDEIVIVDPRTYRIVEVIT
jgi:hypothetical protein